MSNVTKWEHPARVFYGFDPLLCCGMLNATKQDYPTHQPNEETTFIEVQQYLDFKYGASSVDITLPNEAMVKLVVGAGGRVYFQIPVAG